MSVPLLATKLFVPPPRAELVARPRLVERLNAGLARKLTLVSAPAGYGKTTLVADWLHGRSEAALPRQLAWLSLDENDNDPARFLAYLVAALQQVDPEIGQVAQVMLQAPQPSPPEALLTSLLAAPGAAIPLWQFLAVRPAIERAYHKPVTLGWGVWLMPLGFVLAAVAAWWQSYNKFDKGHE